jgi:N-acetylglucosamine-6-phosphate deacetylase
MGARAAGPAFAGFVDLQVNGALGVDFAAPDLGAEDARRAARHVLGGGTAAFLATLVSSPIAVYRRNLPLLAALADEPEFAGRLAGIHLEGPFLSTDARVLGVHCPEHVRAADPALLAEWQRLAGGRVRLVTFAAEIDGAVALTRAARDLGMAVSIGHSWADTAALARVRDAGAVGLTHFGNGVPLSLPRHANPLIAGLATDGLAAMLIADGHHVTAEFAALVRRVKGAQGIVLVSDLSPAAGLAPGRHRVFGADVEVGADGAIRNPAQGHLAGSSASLLACVNQALAWGLLGPEEALAAARDRPAALIGLDLSALRAPDEGRAVCFDAAVASPGRFVLRHAASQP